MASFEPIAIVGRACVLPGARSPEELWDLVHAGRDVVSDAPDGRWRVAPEDVVCGPDDDASDRTWSTRGGYVTGFDSVWNPGGFALPAESLAGLDEGVKWALHCARQALRDAGEAGGPRVSAVYGNLGFPSEEMTRYAESVWFGGPRPDARNRFMSSGSASVLQQALGLSPDTFCIDTACASSLYAIKLACDQLHDRRADVALAGAVNRSDDLFIHVGFTALKAMSKSGQSRPFHAEADGLVPAEGAGFVALKRLSDARRDGNPIYGVIRGVGLSNDGRGRGFLAPLVDGQRRAMERAYASAGIDPGDVSLLECHATGTKVGDATELRSTATFYEGQQDVPIGSLKSNMGHLITAAGVAGLIKVLESMRHGVRPPSLHADVPNPVLGETPFRVVRGPEPWTTRGPRIAAVSAFGFGGNNAHLIVSEDDGQAGGVDPVAPQPVAVVGMGAVVGDATDLGQFADVVRGSRPFSRQTQDFELGLSGLKFPPTDLEETLPQQLLVLKAAREATDGVELPHDTTGVYMGFEPDTEVCRYGARWRMGEVLRAAGLSPSEAPEWYRENRDAVVPRLTSAGVVGTMPNIPANRLNSQFDLGGASVTTSSIAESGLCSLHLAARALAAGEVDAALVAAVDLSANEIHEAALGDLGLPVNTGDAAVVLVLKRIDDARRDGDRIFATVTPAPMQGATSVASRDSDFGQAWAAGGLRDLVATALGEPGRYVCGGLYPATVHVDQPIVPRPRNLEGPTLSFQAHRPPVRLTEVPGVSSRFAPTPHRSENTMQKMPEAPSLPSTQSGAPSPVIEPARAPEMAASNGHTNGRVNGSANGHAVNGHANGHANGHVNGYANGYANGNGANGGVANGLGQPNGQVGNGQLVRSTTGNLPSMQAALAEIGELQRRFLANQTAVFEQFMAVQNFGLSQLAGPSMNGGRGFATGTPGEGRVEAVTPGAPGGSSEMNGAKTLSRATTDERRETRNEKRATSFETVTPGTPGGSSGSDAATTLSRATRDEKRATRDEKRATINEKRETRFETVTPGTPGGSSEMNGANTLSRAKRNEKRETRNEQQATSSLQPTGPTFDREQLKIHASGKISEIFGEQFEVQDGFARQVRMPTPPLLLADRVTGLDAEPGSMNQTGTIWTESDIYEGRWYLHQGHIPAGIMIESGQADLMLISYLGVDFRNRGERIYRLLGCELTYHGGLPKVGDTMKYDIHLDGHAAQGETRLMFFHYDCRVDGDVRLSVRKGQAGFFTDEELANSDGCIWKPETQEIVDNPRLDAPFVELTKTTFSQDEVRAFADGRPWDCFGDQFYLAKTHTRTPQIQSGKMLFLGDTEFENRGGPWGRGYLKSTVEIDPDHWFFDGHFHNDPCMPGTLMFEGCLQALAFHLTAQGYTLERDGWRFEPVEGEPFLLNCRGQVTPDSSILTYEVFVEEVIAGPEPTVYADLLCTIDGLKAFHARRVGLRLIPSWPLDEGDELLEGYEETRPVATADGFPFDYRSMLACANGRPSEAFGPIYEPFDSPTRVARLPNPPYHFLSRVARVEGDIGSMQKGMEVDVEYDIPEDAWYFDENGCRAMPFAVLLEAALQPCGWLASYLGCALTVEEGKELFFRNLDGNGTLHTDLVPTSGRLLTKVQSTNISKTGPMIIVSFDVQCLVDDEVVYDMDTVFGFFPAEALANQVGLPTSDEQRALQSVDSPVVCDLTTRPAPYWRDDRPQLAEPMMLMIDRVTHFDPEGGEAGLGALRADKDVDPAEWFFKAHFFQDPVQPGSLGIEAMIQLLQWYMLETGMDDGIENPRFETLSNAHTLTWKYRGQVIPSNELIQTTLEIVEVGRDDDGAYAVANASLWVDGKRIYEAFNMGMRIVSGGAGEPRTFTLDPAEDSWLGDHCPTFALPALPMMSMVDYMAQAASIADPVVAMRDVRVKGWLAFDSSKTLMTRRRGDDVTLVEVLDDGAEKTVATAKVETGMYRMRPAPWASLEGPPAPNPYESGELFHGPAFQVLETLVRTGEGASATLRVESGVPVGRLNPGLLDGLTHAIPHDQLHMWDDRISPDKVAYPAFIPELTFYGKTPLRGTVRCEVRPDGFVGSPDFPAFRAQIISDEGVWCELRLVEACFPKGKLGSVDPLDRRAFLRDLEFVPGVALSEDIDGTTMLQSSDVEAVSWLPGTLEHVYRTSDHAAIAGLEHIARAHGVHPGKLPEALPITRLGDVDIVEGDGFVKVEGDATGVLDIAPVRDFWTEWFGRTGWPVEDLYYGLIERFVNRVVLTDPDAFAAMDGRSLLYLGNHQVGVESLLFSIIASALNSVPTLTLAKIEHKETWLGQLIDLCFRYPEIKDPGVIAFFDRDDRESLPRILGDLAAEMATVGRSVMVHVEGTRSLECRTPVQKMSGAFIDMALEVGAPVVPVRFLGALPSEPLEQRLEFPIGMGKQDIWIGRPFLPEELAKHPYGVRKQMVIDAINALGPSNAVEQPYPGDADFDARVENWLASNDVTHEHAVLHTVLSEIAEPTSGTAELLRASESSDIAGDLPEGAWLRELAERLLGR